jgi:hypothetical protein
MVPLSGQSDGSYDDGKTKGSSTEFFAIPHVGRAGQGGPPAAAPMGPPPMVGGQIQGPVPVGPMAIGGIIGPVVGGQGMPGGMSPYGVPPEPERTQSFRVFGVMIALVTMVCIALVFTVGLVTFAVWNQTQPPPPPQVTVAPPPQATAPAVDTGIGTKGTKVPTPVPVKPVGGPRPTSEPRPVKPAAAPTEVNGASAAGEVGTITVRKPADIYATEIEAKCGAWRERAKFVNDVAVLNGVPAEDCEIRFKGGTVSTRLTSKGGRSFSCTARGTTDLDCR